jgi:DNA polymerase-3 subunit beta
MSALQKLRPARAEEKRAPEPARPAPAFKVAAGALRLALDRMALVVKPSQVPILMCVMLDVRDGEVVVRSIERDMALWVSETMPATVERPTKIVVPFRSLRRLVKLLPRNAEVVVASDLLTVEVSVLGLSVRMPTLPAEDWPQPPALHEQAVSEMQAGDLLRLIGMTRYAVSDEETRYYLNGICLEGDADGACRAVATDGHRLAIEEAPAGTLVPGRRDIVPRAALAPLAEVLRAVPPEVPVTMEWGVATLRASVGRHVLAVKLIDGTFPEWRRVVPKAEDAKHTLAVLRPGVLAALIERVTVVRDSQFAPIVFEAVGGTLTIRCHSMEGGDARMVLPDEVATWAGPDLTFGAQARYLRPVFASFPQGASFRFIEGSAPIVITAPEHEGRMSVLMPMRV